MEKSSYASFNKRKSQEAPLHAWELDVPTYAHVCVQEPTTCIWNILPQAKQGPISSTIFPISPGKYRGSSVCY